MEGDGVAYVLSNCLSGRGQGRRKGWKCPEKGKGEER